MKIFNEDLKKYLSVHNGFDDFFGDFIFIYGIVFANFLVGYLILLIGGFIKKDGSLTSTDTNIPYILLFILTIFALFLCNFMMNNRYKKQLQKNKSPNPIIEKLKDIYKNNSSLNRNDLIDVWREYNSINPNYTNTDNDANTNVIILNTNEEGIKLFQKLDDDLVYFIENADNATIKLFNLESFDSYQKLYMKYIALKEKIYLLERIQNLLASLSNENSHKENPIIQQLNELKNEINKYDINTVDYFEFKKWNNDTWKFLKLDKDNEMIKSNYQNIIQEINSNQKAD